MFRTFRSNPFGGFSYVPIIPYRSGFAVVRQLDRGLLICSVPSVCTTLSKDNRAAKCTRGARPCLFFLSLILPGRRRTLNLQTQLLRALLPRCVLRYALREPTPRADPRRSCMPCKIMHVFTAQLAFSLCGLLGFCPVVPSQHGHRFAQSWLSRCSAQSLDSTKLLGSSTLYYHCVQYNSVAWTVFRRLLCPPIIIILLISGCLQYLRHHCRLGLSTATIPLASLLSLKMEASCKPALAFFGAFSASLRASVNPGASTGL